MHRLTTLLENYVVQAMSNSMVNLVRNGPFLLDENDRKKKKAKKSI